MRNLKRVLSLAMAALMLMGMMVVSAGAASTYDSFTDKDEIVNTEAVNTIVSLGVMGGKPGADGTLIYDPAATVKRGEMAKIIALCLNGGKEPVLGNSTNIPKFSDVPTDHWAYNYIAYCVQLGIIAGHGDGTFAPEAPVTGSQAAKMFLCALGYRADLEGLVGAEWELNTNILANQEAKLYEGLESIMASEGLNRDNTAQMAYNAIQAREVQYRNLEGSYEDVLQITKGNTMLYNRFKVVKVTGILEANDKMSVLGNNVALEGKSLINVSDVTGGPENADYSDIEGQRSFTVETSDEMVGQEIVIYVRFLNDLAPNAASSTVIGEPILTDNNTVVETSARLKDTDAVRSTLRAGGMSNVGTPVEVRYTENTVTVSKDTKGVTDSITKALRGADKNNDGSDDYTRSAGIFQRFIDNDGNGTPDYIIQIVPVLTSVNSISTDGETYTFTGIDGSISVADIVTDEELARNDMVLVNKFADDCYYVSYPETVEGTVSAFNTNNNTVLVDGTSYGNSGGKNLGVSGVDQILTEEKTIDNTFIFYMDPAGNVLGYKETAAVIGNYAIVKGYDRTGNPNMGYSATVKLLMQDGTTGTYSLNLAASAVNLGLAEANESTQAKEDAITIETNDWVGDSSNEKHGTKLVGHLFSYTLENNTVTLSKAEEVNSNYDNLNGTFTKLSKNIATYNGTVANDQTVFFIKDTKNNTYVVTGLSKLAADSKTVVSSEIVAYKAPGTSTYIAKAIFVTLSEEYKAAREYVYVTDKYVRTTTSGTPVYSFTVVYPDGTTAQMETKSNVNTIKNKVCEFDYDGSYVNFYPDESVAYNKMYVQSVANNTVTLGNKDTGVTEESLRINANAAIWDVQDEPVADALAENDIVSLIVDTEGAVKAAFIYDVMTGDFVESPLDPATGSSIIVNDGTTTGETVNSEGEHVSLTTMNVGDKITGEVKLPNTVSATLTANETTTVKLTPKAAARSTVEYITYTFSYEVTAADMTRGYVEFALVLSQSGLDSLTVNWTVGTTAPGGDPVTPPEETDEAITSVTVTMPALTVGQALPTATTSTTNVTVSTKWDATGNVEAGKTYTATVTLTAADGYKFTKDTTVTAGANGTVTAPTADTKTITVTYTIKVDDEGSVTPPVTGEYAPGTYAVDTTGTTPVVTIYQHADKVYTEAELIAYVKQAGYNITALADYSAVAAGTAGIVEGTAGTVCTVKVAEVVSLSVDGTVVKYAVVGTAIPAVDLSTYVKTNATLVVKSTLTKAVDPFNQYAWGTPATKTDVELINAYAFKAGTGVAKVELWDAEKKAYDSTDKKSAVYLPCDAKIKVTGTASTATTDAGKIFRLTVNGEAYGKENIAPTDATTYTYELSNLGSLLDKDGKLTVAEESGYKVSINGTVLSGLFAGTEDMSSETELGLTASQVGTYLAVVDGNDLIASTGAFEIEKGALDPDTNTFPYTMTGTLAADMVDKTTGTITLRPAVTVKFNEGGGNGKTEFGKITGTSILHNGYKLAGTADVTYAKTLYVVKGTTFTVTTVAGSALATTALNLNETDYGIAYKVLDAAGTATGDYVVTTGDKLTVTGADDAATLSATFTLDQGVEFDIVETDDEGATWTGVNNTTT